MLVPLVVLSGMTALVYEVCWFKRFEHAWGVAPIAMGAVVASFLLGLGLGARRLGAFADRVRRPLAAYGWCELGIGLLALLVPLELALLQRLVPRAYPLLVDRPLLGGLMQFALSFVVLGPPCFLMGGTLPLLVKAIARPGVGVGRATGTLYALNALGAATGAYLAGFHLLPALGIRMTTWVAVAGNLVIAAAAIGLGHALPKRPGAAEAPEPRTAAQLARPERPPRAWTAPAIAFLAGGSALLLQIVWMRQTALIVGGSTYAFSAVLTVILIGIGLGSFVSRAGLGRDADPSRRRRIIQLALGFLAVSVVATQLAIPWIVDLVSAAVELRPNALYNAIVCIAAAAALVLVPSLAFGFLFPWVIAARFRAAGTEGNTVGSITWWNTLGCLAGASAAPLFLIPTLGTHATIGIAIGLAWTALLIAEGLGARVRRAFVPVAAPLGVALVVLGARERDPLRLNLGAYSSGYHATSAERVLFFREGRTCNVLVTQGSNRALRLNGKVDASDLGDMPTQLGSAYFARFLRPFARDYLVLGFGSGTTSGALLLDPNARVTCCEVEAEVLAASPYFGLVNHRPEQSPRFDARVVDGRMHLAGSGSTYDVIVSVPSNPWVAGIGNLFTRSFYEAAEARLRDDGMLVQWLQTYEMSGDDYTLVLRTIGSVFANVGILRVDDLDTLVLASNGALLPTAEDLAAAQAFVESTPAVARDLVRWFGTRDVGRLLVRHFVTGPEGVRRALSRSRNTSLHTLDAMQLEFNAGRSLFGYTLEGNALVLSCIDGSWQRALLERCRDPAAAAVELRGLAEAMNAAGIDDTSALDAAGFEAVPDDAYLAMRAVLARPPVDPEEFAARVRDLAAASPEISNLLGGLFWQNGDPGRSAQVFALLLEQWPTSATLWANLSIAQRALGAQDHAAASLQRALEHDPWNEFVRGRVDAEQARGE